MYLKFTVLLYAGDI